MRFGSHLLRLRAPALCLVILGAACAPGATGGRTTADESAPTGAPRVLRMAMITGSEPADNIVFSSGGTGGGEHPFMLHSGLTVYDPHGNLQPRLALKV